MPNNQIWYLFRILHRMLCILKPIALKNRVVEEILCGFVRRGGKSILMASHSQQPSHRWRQTRA